MNKKVYIECNCYSIEHVMRFSYLEKEPDEIFIETHLKNYINFWDRFLIAIKYIFGYRTKYGDFDCIIISPTTVTKLRDSLNLFLEENKRYEKDK